MPPNKKPPLVVVVELQDVEVDRDGGVRMSDQAFTRLVDSYRKSTLVRDIFLVVSGAVTAELVRYLLPILLP